MTALATDLQMARKRSASPRGDEAVRIRSDVAAKARIAASFMGESITDYLSRVLEPIVNRDIDDGYARVSKGSIAPKKPRAKRTDSN